MKYLKMDRATAKYLSENFWNMTDGRFEMLECKECGSQYLEEVGHYCGDSITLKAHDIKEGDVVEPIKIIPPSHDIERGEVIDNVFDFLKGE